MVSTMKLIIDTRSGIAGDIVSAGIIGLGANENKIISNMEYAGNYLGKTIIKKLIDNNSIKLDIQIKIEKEHLYESKAKEILEKILNELKIIKFYYDIAQNILDVLCEAEKFVHSSEKFSFLNLETDYQNNKHKNVAVLHEAKDILIDIIGFTTGLKELRIKEVYYLAHVNVGNGKINFSHGVFNVPAPATEYILNKYGIVWKKSHLPEEMATPTGVSILAGCTAKRIDTLKDYKIIKKAQAKGTKKLQPITFYLIE